MRKTLHTLPLPLASAAHTATLRFRERDALRALYNAGLQPDAVAEITRQVCELLADGPRAYRTIETMLASAADRRQAVRLAIKLAWERGTLAYLNTSDSWNREARSFTLTKTTYPALDLTPCRAQALTTLVTAYLHRYGPATIRDITWWSGLSASDIRAALLASDRELITVTTPWSSQPCLMFADQLHAARAHLPATGVQFLAHEDTALKAYYETRSRYLAGLPQTCAFNQIGEALPAILINGQTAGIWSWDPHSQSVKTHVFGGKLTTPTLRKQIRTRSAAMTHTLRSNWSPARIPRRQ